VADSLALALNFSCLLRLHVVGEFVLDALAFLIGALVGVIPVVLVIRFFTILAVDEALEVLVLRTARLQVLVKVLRRVSELIHLGSCIKRGHTLAKRAPISRYLPSSPGLSAL